MNIDYSKLEVSDSMGYHGTVTDTNDNTYEIEFDAPAIGGLTDEQMDGFFEYHAKQYCQFLNVEYASYDIEYCIDN